MLAGGSAASGNTSGYLASRGGVSLQEPDLKTVPPFLRNRMQLSIASSISSSAPPSATSSCVSPSVGRSLSLCIFPSLFRGRSAGTVVLRESSRVCGGSDRGRDKRGFRRSEALWSVQWTGFTAGEEMGREGSTWDQHWVGGWPHTWSRGLRVGSRGINLMPLAKRPWNKGDRAA